MVIVPCQFVIIHMGYHIAAADRKGFHKHHNFTEHMPVSKEFVAASILRTISHMQRLIVIERTIIVVELATHNLKLDRMDYLLLNLILIIQHAIDMLPSILDPSRQSSWHLKLLCYLY